MGASSPSRKKMMSEINITPFVDVMLVLLIIFMVTAPLMQQGLEVELPKTASSGVSSSEKPFVLTIKANKTLLIGEATVPTKNLRSKLKAIFETRTNKQIYIKADRRVDYGTVAEAMAEVRAAGIYKIGLITLPKF